MVDEKAAKKPEGEEPTKKVRKTGKEREEELKQIREKKEQQRKEEELTEEDLKLKKDLDLLVERAHDGDAALQKSALEQLCTQIRSSTSSMTAVPKPLKFLRPHYKSLKELYDENKVNAANKSNLADVLSILGMTMGSKSRDCLHYKLAGTGTEMGSWGHEYVRTLAGEIGEEFAEKSQAGEDVEYLHELVREIVPFNMKHNSEPEACDLLMETERLSDIVAACDEDNYERVCLYLSSCAHYVPEPEDTLCLKLVYDIYLKFNQRCDAMRMALRLHDRELAEAAFVGSTDETERKQLGYLLARQLMKFDTDDETIASILNNASLSENYLALAKDLDVLEPKSPEDIYKSHLSESNNTIGADSARANLASTFVNAFVNCGYGHDTLMTVDGSKWVYKNKDHGMTSAVASLGLINLWDVDEGLAQLDKYLYVDDVNIKTGAILAIGLVAASIRDDDVDPAFALLVDHLESAGETEKIGVVLGFALAYAGSAREDILEVLVPVLSDSSTSHELACFVALAIGIIFVGTCNEVMQEIFNRLSELSETDAKQNLTRQMALGLGLLFLARKEDSDVCMELAKTLPDPLKKTVMYTIEVCAYTGTGNVLKVQSLLNELTMVAPEPAEGEQPADLSHLMIPTLGIALVSLGDDLGIDMALRQYDHLLQYGDVSIRRAVPIALSLASISNPRLTIMDTLNKLTHDADQVVSMNAIFALGLIGAGTNNARIAATLRHLSSYYSREQNHLFVVRLAQGFLHLGKGTLTLNPYHSEREVLSYASVAGILPVAFAALDIKSSFLGRYHYLLYMIATALYPRMLITVDEDLNMINVPVRVGEAVDTVGQAGKPKTITGFQTHTSPVLLPFGHRAELATEEYLAVANVLEGIAILKKNPEYVPPENESDVIKKRS